MDLQHYVDGVRHELALAAQAGGDEATALAERLTAPLESAIRLAILEALSDAAELITSQLAPGSVEVRLRGRNPDFFVTVPEVPAEDNEPELVDDDESATWRVTLRLPERLRPRIESAARRDGTSLNTWLVRAAAARIEPAQRTKNPRHISGWVR